MYGFFDLNDLSRSEISDLLDLARDLKKNPKSRALEGKVLALLFLSPSLRTSTSFQSAMARLGGSSFVVTPESGIHGLETSFNVKMDGTKAEHIREAIPVLASYGDVLGIRSFAPQNSLADDLADIDFKKMAALSSIPVINMESAIRHPCQSLADWLTMEDLAIPDRAGKLVLSWANHPKSLPLAVPVSTVHMAAMRGMEVTVLRPSGFELPESVMASARQLAAESGGSVTETDNQREALDGADVIYAKAWSSSLYYGDDATQRELKKNLTHWCVDDTWFEGAADHCQFMHCLPVRRGVVVDEKVLEGPRSIVVQQARNRMWAQMAILHKILVPKAQKKTEAM